MPRRNRGERDGAGSNLIAKLQAELVRSKKQESHHSRGAFRSPPSPPSDDEDGKRSQSRRD